MNKIPEKIQRTLFWTSGLFFLFLTFVIGPTNLFGLSDILMEKTGYFFGVAMYFLDYALIASIPIFGMLYNSTRIEFKFKELIRDVLTVFFSTVLIFVLGLYILTFIERPSSPLIPEILLTEPFYLYSAAFIALGLLTPYILVKIAGK